MKSTISYLRQLLSNLIDIITKIRNESHTRFYYTPIKMAGKVIELQISKNHKYLIT